MKIQSRSINALGGLAIASSVARWMATLSYRGAFYDRAVDPAHPEFRGPALFLFWHEYIPFLFYLRGHCNISMLLSQHADAEWLSQAARHMGFGTVRGSTKRGGAAALLELSRRGKSQNLAITPDGPRGPRRQLKQGAIYLASRAQIPIVAIGLGYDRPWRMNSWDRFAIPRPFSRARGIVSPPLQIPADIDRDGVEHYRRSVEATLNELTETAERWAVSGGEMENECAVRQEAAPLKPRGRNLVEQTVHARWTTGTEVPEWYRT